MVLECLCFFQPSNYKGGIGYAGGGMNGVHTSGICEVPLPLTVQIVRFFMGGIFGTEAVTGAAPASPWSGGCAGCVICSAGCCLNPSLTFG